MVDDSYYDTNVYFFMRDEIPHFSLQWAGKCDSFNDGTIDELLGDLIELSKFRIELKDDKIDFNNSVDIDGVYLWKYGGQLFLYGCVILINQYFDEDLEYWEGLEIPNYDFFEMINCYIDMIVSGKIELNMKTFDSFISYYGFLVPPRKRGHFYRDLDYEDFVWSFEASDYEHLTAEYIINDQDDKCVFYQYSCCGYRDVLIAILQFLALNECSLKRCKFCGRLFVPQRKANQKYCTRNYGKISCLEEGRKEVRREREAKNLVNKRYNSVNTNLARWAKDKRVSKWRRDERLQFLFDFRDEYQEIKRELSEEEIIDWLNEMNGATHSDL